MAAAPTSAVRQSFSPEIPGKLDDGGGGGDEELSKTDGTYLEHPGAANWLVPQLPLVLASLGALAFSMSHLFLAILLSFSAAYARYVANADSDKSDVAKQVRPYPLDYCERLLKEYV